MLNQTRSRRVIRTRFQKGTSLTVWLNRFLALVAGYRFWNRGVRRVSTLRLFLEDGRVINRDLK